MPVWQVALLLNLTFAVGLGLGYAGWGRRAEALDKQFDAVQHEPGRLQNHAGIPGRSYRIFRFIVKGNAGDSFTLRYEAQKAKAVETSIQLK